MVKNITIALFLGLFMLSAQSGIAQDSRGQRIQQLRIAFITDQLDLSVEEAQQFWPLFNAFHDNKKKLEKEIKQGKRMLSEKEEIAESELKNYLDLAARNHAQIVELENQFLQSSLPILGSKRTLMMMHLEDRFRKRLIEEKLMQKHERKE